MKPPLPRILSDIPRTLHAQLEVAKAIRTLIGPDARELAQQRHGEIAAIRHDLGALARDLPKAFEEAVKAAKAEVFAALKKYSPDQPRVPAGNRDGGQWTSGSKVGSDTTGAPAESPDANSDEGLVTHIHLAVLEQPTGTGTDAGGYGGITVDTKEGDTKNVVSNLYDVLRTVARSKFGPGINHIWADEIPIDHSRYPEQFVDSSGQPIVVDGNPVLRPADLPPQRYIRAALAMRDLIAEYKQGGFAAEGAAPLTAAALALLPRAGRALGGRTI